MRNENIKGEFWEENFIEKQEMWGLVASNSAVLSKDFFIKNSIKDILIPGIGYGRNAQVFIDNGIRVTGIEISKTTIEMARKHYGAEMTIYHGSVLNMPFDNHKYDGMFCYGLIHLFDSSKRQRLIANCFHQLSKNGYMIFTAISKDSATYGKGKLIDKDRYELFEGVAIYYYDRASIEAEFEKFGLFEIIEINENFPSF